VANRSEPPKKVDGWVRSERPRKVNRKNIFDYMDGAGELYLAYSFVRLEAWTYKKAGAPEILLEIYEIKDPADAFGVLSFDLNGEELGIGQKSVYGAGLLRFWEGRHFVRVLAEAETPATREAVMKMGKDVQADLAGKGTRGDLPELVVRLPKTGLLPQSVHYFHTNVCLAYFYFLADENILGLSEKTNAVMADYGPPVGRGKLLVVEYPSEPSSRRAWEKFHAVYLEEKLAKGGAVQSKKIEGGQWVSCAMHGSLLLVVFEAKSQEESERLLRGATSSFIQGG
jgi:hypothetical protein